MTVSYSRYISYGIYQNNVYVINEVSQKLYYLENVSSAFWRSMERHCDLDSIIYYLSTLYSVELSVLRQDIMELVEQLLNFGIITLEYQA